MVLYGVIMASRTPPALRPPHIADFDPVRHREALVAIVRAIESLPDDGGVVPPADFDRILRAHPRDGQGFFSRSQIIAGFRAFGPEVGFQLDEAAFVRRVQLRPVRTQSGVTPLTVLTKPFPCPGRCVFCPNDVRMPKSYLADEPGAQRAAHSHFDPYDQTWNRLATYRAIGHPIDKIELIILGGTWSAYPEAYQIWFVKRCFDALSDFGEGIDGRGDVDFEIRDFANLADSAGQGYDATVSSHLRKRLDGRLLARSESATWLDLESAHRRNETAVCRNVGLVVETRPDRVNAAEVLRIRRLGCTKVQIGIQSLSDEILEKNGRGHDVASTRQALRLLRAAGFKIHAHWMPNLLGSTPSMEQEDFSRLFDDEDIRPDELKIYPCSLIETAELMDHYRSGAWRPYTHDELLEVIVGALAKVPRYCRVTRVIRDISSDDIVVGNKLTNFRQIAEQELARRGGHCIDIRSREIKRERFNLDQLVLRETAYSSAVGEERFLEMVTEDDRLAGFLRLSLPVSAVASETPEALRGCAVIREVHVYGASLGLGLRDGDRAQHRGLGSQLVEAAVQRARAGRFDQIAVISAVGTRDWYRRLGFEDGPLYQRRPLDGDR